MKRSLEMVAAIGMILLAACGSDAVDVAGTEAVSTESVASATEPIPSDSPPANEAFPLTVTNGLGTVDVANAPIRVVAVGDAELDVLLSLGVVPTTYVGYSDKLLPYQEAALDGAPAPEMLSLVDGVPFEEIAAADPDLIVSLSWTDEDNYPVLNDIAPVVAYVDDPWGDSWQTQVDQIAGALGRAADGEALIADIEAQVADAAAANPALGGATVTFTSADGGTVCSVDLQTSPVLVFLRELGLEPTLDDPASAYCAEHSYEQLDAIDADVMLIFGTRDELEASPLFQQLPGVIDGNVIWLDDTMANAVNSPTPLAIPAFLDAVVPQMAAAAS